MRLFNRIIRRFTRKQGELYLDEIFLDATNLPAFDVHQFEGRMVHPISKRAALALMLAFVLIVLVFVGRLWMLQVSRGEAYVLQSEQNRLHKKLIFADRGIIYDRVGMELAWNAPHESEPFAERMYWEDSGLAHLIGYLSYPQKDTAGIFYQENYIGIEGVENTFDDVIQGENGVRLIETNARGEVRSENITRSPKEGESLTLSIDARVQTKLYEFIASLAEEVGFAGGAGVVMDVQTGEVLAITSYPEYSSVVLSRGEPDELVTSYILDEQKPFLNRPVSGLYAPGSIIKPFIAAGVLEEELIDPKKEIMSTGSIRVPNPYLPGQYSIFNDWKAHGLVDMRHALAVSSNVYFYYVGGGFEDQPGLGIENIDKYMRAFGFGKPTGITLPSEGIGVIPTPAWKAETFSGEPWRIGDTYNTTIGQYGFQVTPLQVVRAIAAIANGGVLVTPTLVFGERNEKVLVDIDEAHLAVVREGVRLAVLEGTAAGLNVPSVSVAAKTGTAERGTAKDYVNSWVTGFFPYEQPRYAFVVTMERGPRRNLLGGVSVMRSLLDWMVVNTPEYLEQDLGD